MIFSRARWSRRIIIIASFLFLLILSPLRSQAPPRGPHVPTDAERIVTPGVSLQPKGKIVEIGEQVKFTAKVSPAISGLSYRFSDTDGTTIITSNVNQPEAVAQFSTPGPHTLTVLVFLVRSRLELTDSATIQVEGSKPRRKQGPGGPSSPSTTTQSGTVRKKTKSITHTFKAPGNYTVSVTVARGPSRGGDKVGIRIDPPLSPWVYVVVGLVVVALGYLIYKVYKALKPVPPTFHPYWDRATPQKQQENVTVNYELHFDPNLSKGRQRLETGEASLIISRKNKQ